MALSTNVGCAQTLNLNLWFSGWSKWSITNRCRSEWAKSEEKCAVGIITSEKHTRYWQIHWLNNYYYQLGFSDNVSGK